MADGFSVTVDSAALLAALNRVGDGVQKHVKAAARVTAVRISSEMRGRVARGKTGGTAQGIDFEETHDGDGYVVFSANKRMPGLPGWLEYGTRKMRARPYFHSSVRLEEGPHMRRISQAVEDAITESGLGS